MTGVPQRTISSTAGGADAGRVGLPECTLIGMLGQGQQTVADGVAGGLVPGHHQQDEEGRHFRWAERLAVDVGVDEGRGHVVGGIAPAGFGQLGHEQVQLLGRQS